MSVIKIFSAFCRMAGTKLSTKKKAPTEPKTPNSNRHKEESKFWRKKEDGKAKKTRRKKVSSMLIV